MKRTLPLIALVTGCSPPIPQPGPQVAPSRPAPVAQALPAPLEKIFADFLARYGADFWKVPPGRIESPPFPQLLLNYPAPVTSASASAISAEPTFGQLAKETEAKYSSNLQANEELLQKSRFAYPDAQFAPAIALQWAVGLYAQRRAYAQVGYDYRDGYVGRVELGIVRWALAQGDPRSDFAYTRQRFILESVFGDVASIPVGRALLAKAPDDVELRRAFAFHLAHSDQRSELDEALRIATDLARQDPTRLSFVRLPALIYQNRYNCLGHRREDRSGEIEWLRRYISIAQRTSRPRVADGVDAVASAQRRLADISR